MMRIVLATLLLASGAADAAEPAKSKVDEAEKAADNGEKMICKRFVETGSLVKGYRSCKTKRDWERERDALRTTNLVNSCANQGSTGSC